MLVNLPDNAHAGKKLAFYLGARASFREEHNNKGRSFRDARAILTALIGDAPAYIPVIESGRATPLQQGVIKDARFQHIKMWWQLALEGVPQGDKAEARVLYRATKDLWTGLRVYNKENYKPRTRVLRGYIQNAIRGCRNNPKYDAHNLDCFTDAGGGVLNYTKPAGRISETFLAAHRWLKVHSKDYAESSPEIEAVREAIHTAKQRAYLRLYWTPDITKIIADTPYEDLPDPNENFTTYTEVDGPGKITVTPPKVAFTAVDRDETTYVYKDFGAGHFTNLTHLIAHEITTKDDNAGISFWHISDVLGDDFDLLVNSDVITWRYFRNGANNRYIVQEAVAGDSSNSDFFEYATDEKLWPEIVKDNAVGSFGDVTVEMFNDVDRTSSVDVLNILLRQVFNPRYLSVASSFNSSSSGFDITGYLENYDLQEPVAAAMPLINSGLINNGLTGGRLVN